MNTNPGQCRQKHPEAAGQGSIRASWPALAPIYQDLEEKKKRDVAISVKPPKNIGPAAKRRSGIHHDKENDMSDDRGGTSKKNIVTKPLSLSVTVKAI
jgi:hypothetical protein